MINMKENLVETPLLYSFRRCPYAIRARMAIAYADISVAIREVVLSNKPEHLLLISPKGTVPVLQLADGVVIEESLEIMQWALAQNDPEHWLASGTDAERLVRLNDAEFKYYLDRYKYADRYPNYSQAYYRLQAEGFLIELETRLSKFSYLCGGSLSIADVAIFPFIRQFASVEPEWFQNSAYDALKKWLELRLSTDLFARVMAK